MGSWHPRAVCRGCGWHAYAWAGSLFLLDANCCPRCGGEKFGGGFGIYRMRWVTRARWWNPLSWFSGAWEFHPDTPAPKHDDG